jgi:hypothetical protein
MTQIYQHQIVCRLFVAFFLLTIPSQISAETSKVDYDKEVKSGYLSQSDADNMPELWVTYCSTVLDIENRNYWKTRSEIYGTYGPLYDSFLSNNSNGPVSITDKTVSISASSLDGVYYIAIPEARPAKILLVPSNGPVYIPLSDQTKRKNCFKYVIKHMIMQTDIASDKETGLIVALAFSKYKNSSLSTLDKIGQAPQFLDDAYSELRKNKHFKGFKHFKKLKKFTKSTETFNNAIGKAGDINEKLIEPIIKTLMTYSLMKENLYLRLTALDELISSNGIGFSSYSMSEFSSSFSLRSDPAFRLAYKEARNEILGIAHSTESSFFSAIFSAASQEKVVENALNSAFISSAKAYFTKTLKSSLPSITVGYMVGSYLSDVKENLDANAIESLAITLDYALFYNTSVSLSGHTIPMQLNQFLKTYDSYQYDENLIDMKAVSLIESRLALAYIWSSAAVKRFNFTFFSENLSLFGKNILLWLASHKQEMVMNAVKNHMTDTMTSVLKAYNYFKYGPGFDTESIENITFASIYSDVGASHKFATMIDKVSRFGMMEGEVVNEENLFRPNDIITKGEFLQSLVALSRLQGHGSGLILFKTNSEFSSYTPEERMLLEHIEAKHNQLIWDPSTIEPMRGFFKDGVNLNDPVPDKNTFTSVVRYVTNNYGVFVPWDKNTVITRSEAAAYISSAMGDILK